MLLAQDPKLLLVDEPAAGMTDEETAETAKLLKRIAETHTVIVVEHDMTFVRDLGVKVTVLHEGSVLAEGSLDHVSADPRVVEVYLGAYRGMLTRRKPRPSLRRGAGAPPRLDRRRGRQGDLRARPQRRR